MSRLQDGPESQGVTGGGRHSLTLRETLGLCPAASSSVSSLGNSIYFCDYLGVGFYISRAYY